MNHLPKESSPTYTHIHRHTQTHTHSHRHSHTHTLIFSHLNKLFPMILQDREVLTKSRWKLYSNLIFKNFQIKSKLLILFSKKLLYNKLIVIHINSNINIGWIRTFSEPYWKSCSVLYFRQFSMFNAIKKQRYKYQFC